MLGLFKGNERNWFRNLELFRNKKLELLKKTNTFNLYQVILVHHSKLKMKYKQIFYE